MCPGARADGVARMGSAARSTASARVSPITAALPAQYAARLRSPARTGHGRDVDDRAAACLCQRGDRACSQERPSGLTATTRSQSSTDVRGGGRGADADHVDEHVQDFHAGQCRRDGRLVGHIERDRVRADLAGDGQDGSQVDVREGDAGAAAVGAEAVAAPIPEPAPVANADLPVKLSASAADRDSAVPWERSACLPSPP